MGGDAPAGEVSGPEVPGQVPSLTTLRGQFQFHADMVSKYHNSAAMIKAGLRAVIESISDEDILKAERIEIIGIKRND